MTPVSVGNGPRFAARPIAAGGTPTDDWVGWRRPFPELCLDDCPALVLVAPHPDDETLGFGATAATLRARGIDVQVVSA
ncbi:MAG TPA: PIG-L family deacetylase, partial [Mycobacterium sp.]